MPVISNELSVCDCRCSLRRSTLYYAWLLPMATIIAHNLVVFALVVKVLCHRHRPGALDHPGNSSGVFTLLDYTISQVVWAIIWLLLLSLYLLLLLLLILLSSLLLLLLLLRANHLDHNGPLGRVQWPRVPYASCFREQWKTTLDSSLWRLYDACFAWYSVDFQCIRYDWLTRGQEHSSTWSSLQCMLSGSIFFGIELMVTTSKRQAK